MHLGKFWTVQAWKMIWQTQWTPYAPDSVRPFCVQGCRTQKMGKVSSPISSLRPRNNIRHWHSGRARPVPLDWYWRGSRPVPTRPPPQERWLREMGLDKGAVSLDVSNSVHSTFGNTHNSHWTFESGHAKSDSGAISSGSQYLKLGRPERGKKKLCV